MSLNDGTPDANCDASRGWEQPQGASNILAHESQAYAFNRPTTGFSCEFNRRDVRDEVRFRDNSGGIYPEIQPVTVDRDGGKVTIDAFNRVSQINDAAGRHFQFDYDNKTNDLNRVTNEDGVWTRQKHHGKYSDEWKNDHKQKWQGEVSVSDKGYTFSHENERVTFAPNGSRTKEYLSSGQVFYSDTTLANGRHNVVDKRLGNTQNDNSDKTASPIPVDKHDGMEPKDHSQTAPAHDERGDDRSRKNKNIDDNGVETRKTADGTTVIDHKKNTQLGYDGQGHLTDFTDPRGRSVSFRDFDDNGKPHTIKNDGGVWHKTGPDLWTNDQINKTLHLHVELNKDGYTFSDLSGARVTRNVDGSKIEEYKGIRTRTDINGRVSKEMMDGSPVSGDTLNGSIDFTVNKGVTKAGRLHLSQGDFQVVHSRGGDVHAQIQAAANTPIGALQDGLVLYTYNHDAKVAGRMEARNHPPVSLSDADLSVINHYRQSNPNQDLVVMQCYDPKSKGTRIEIYAGLSLANVAPGERLKAGAVLGKTGDRGYAFAARRNRVSGAAIELTL